jgi:hypothetical protein
MNRSPVALVLVAALLVSTGACRRDERPRAKPALSASASPPVPVAPWTATDWFPNQKGAYRAVLAWHRALERRELDELAKLYTDQVEVSQITYTKDGALEKKRALFAKYPAFFHELIGKVELAKIAEGRVRASFTLKAGTPDDWEVMPASLELTTEPNGSEYLVAGEADAKSLRELELRPACDAKISEVLNSTPPYLSRQTEIQRSAARSNGHASVGGLPPSPDGEGGFVFSIGHFLPDRFSTLLTYRVDRDGRLTVDGELEKQISAAQLKAVEEACRR